MRLKLLRLLFITSIATLTAATASAQKIYNVPSRHENQHKDLLAHQAPLFEQMKLENTQKFIQDVEAREAINDNEIFAKFWDNNSVNPYGNRVEIPAHKTINVADFVNPLKHNRVTSEFGWRPRFGRMHKGIDLGLNVGDTVSSCFPGVVRIAAYNPGGYGYYVVVRHDNGLETVYGHLQRYTVRPGQRVKAGEMIGRGGNTGRSTGPHLHLETRYMGIAINPRHIIDFDNYTTYRETYAFDKASAEREQNVRGPRVHSSKGKSYASKGKARASKGKSKSRRGKRK